MKQNLKTRAKQLGRSLRIEKQVSPIYERYVGIYGPIRVCTLALLLMEGMSSGGREKLINDKKNERKGGIEKSLYVPKTMLPLYERLAGAYGPKRVYNAGLLLINNLLPDDRERLMSILGTGGFDINETLKIVRECLSRKP